jgi:hypothetical protein
MSEAKLQPSAGRSFGLPGVPAATPCQHTGHHALPDAKCGAPTKTTRAATACASKNLLQYKITIRRFLPYICTNLWEKEN